MALGRGGARANLKIGKQRGHQDDSANQTNIWSLGRLLAEQIDTKLQRAAYAFGSVSRRALKSTLASDTISLSGIQSDEM